MDGLSAAGVHYTQSLSYVESIQAQEDPNALPDVLEFIRWQLNKPCGDMGIGNTSGRNGPAYGLAVIGVMRRTARASEEWSGFREF